MLASSKMLPLNVEVEANSHTVGGNSESDMLSANSPKCHTSSHSIHHNRSRNIHHHGRGHSRRKTKSPDLIELSDAGHSPVSGHEDDSSPGMSTDADSEDPYCDTESPTPTNSAVNLDPKSYWQGAEEHRELLATEGEEEEDDDEPEAESDRREMELVDIDSTDSDFGTSNNPSSDSDRGNHSGSDEDIDEEELYRISLDQLAYYKTQFKTLQPDPNGLIGGAQAKQFFEKSRLPTTELSHIWQLSDVTKDGALSLGEFCTAMHLVVLRRNNISLPKHLPPVLDPGSMFEPAVNPPVATTAPTIAQAPAPAPVAPAAPANSAEKEVLTTQVKPVPVSQSTADGAGAAQNWTKFADSPTGSIASPGPQPVNFDFKRAQVEQDPRILHPVALRLTPESQQPDYNSSGAVSLPHAVSGNSLGSTLSNSMAAALTSTAPAGSTGKKEPPPPPPPRPYRGHARSSSLDLNQLGRNTGISSAAPPAVPPRVSPSMSSPRKENEVGSHGSSGAFQVYRRPAVPNNNVPSAVPNPSSATPEKRLVASVNTPASTKGLSSVIEEHRRRGEVLRKQQQLLTKHLFDIQEERNNLELRLQKMHLSDSQC